MSESEAKSSQSSTPVNSTRSAGGCFSDCWARLETRISKELEWRVRRRDSRLIQLGAEGFVRARWPWPLRKPWQRNRLRVASDGKGNGDELMCTAVFAEIKRRNPCCHITFLSRHVDFFKDHPCIDVVEPWSGAVFRHPRIKVGYDHAIPPPRRIIDIIGECVGLTECPNQIVPPPLRPPGDEVKNLAASMPQPWVIVQPFASAWTPNKAWPLENWRKLVNLLLERFRVVEVGTTSAFSNGEFGPRFQSAAGRTNLNDFAWLISQANVFIGPTSAGMHLANAFRIPAVILFGGYETSDGFGYSNMTGFYTPVECAPCWMREPCPYELKCMRAITPEAVFNAVRRAARL